MNPQTLKLIELINLKLSEKPLVYISSDIERGIGLEKLLKNFYFACAESSPIFDQVENGKFCLRNENDLDSKSTLDIVKNANFKIWIEEITKGKEFYAQSFQFNKPVIDRLNELNGILLNNSPELNRKFESKLRFAKLASENNIPVPKYLISNISEINFEDVKRNLNNQNKFVIQIDLSHTGEGSYFVNNEKEFEDIKSKLAGNEVKISEYIEGETYTINSCITKNGIWTAGLQYQITGIKELTPGEGSTIGNDFTKGSKILENVNMKFQILEISKKIGTLMQKEEYKGLFGIDFVIKNDEIFVIEVNARQTANIPFQTKLELKNNQIPLSLINLAEFLRIEHGMIPENDVYPLFGTQLFLRSDNDNLTLNHTINSGIYRLQSDNTARADLIRNENGEYVNQSNVYERKENVIYLDEDQDKPLILQKIGYSIEDIENNSGFVLLVQKKNVKRKKFEEIARIQLLDGIVDDKGNPAQWSIETLKAIKSQL